MDSPGELSNPVTVELAAESIYAHTLVSIEARADRPFTVRVHGARVIDVEQGHLLTGRGVEAEHADGRHRLALRTLGWMRERPVDDPRHEGPQHRYGMRFYPFVSSDLRGRIEVHGGSIAHLVIDLPDRYRVIWFKQAVTGTADYEKEDPVELQHSHGVDRSQFIFSWQQEGTRPVVSLDVPLRLGASALGELVLFPALYLTLSLLGIALAAIAASVSVVIAAVGTTWTFALRQWTNARLPQQSTLLTAGYLSAAVFVLAWGAAWEGLGWPAAALGGPLFGALWYIRRAVKRFRETGTLPRRLVRIWSAYVAWRVSKDRAAATRA